MIREFTLTNFKAFAAEQRIPLRPITLIFGANSSGKSSILHSLLLLRTIFDKQNDTNNANPWDVKLTSIGGNSVDLGGFQQYAHRHDVTKPVSLTFSLPLAATFNPLAHLLAQARELKISLNIGTPTSRYGEARGKPQLESYELQVDGARLFLMARTADGVLAFTLWETAHPVSQKLLEACLGLTTRQQAKPEDATIFSEALNDLLSELRIVVQGGIPCDIDDGGLAPSEGQLGTMLLDKSGDVSDSLRRSLRLFFPRALRDILREVHQKLSSNIGLFDYLGPLRSYPSRFLSEGEHNDPNWYAGGGFAWQTVMENELVRTRVNGWLGQEVLKSRYRLEVRRLADEETIRRRLEKSLADHDTSLIMQVADREEKGNSIADEIDLTTFEPREYVAANPILHESLAENFFGAHRDFLIHDRGDDEAAQYYTMDEAKDAVLDACSGTAPLYWEQVREHYLENHPELAAIASSLSDPAKSAELMTKRIVNEPEVTRSELALIDLRTNTTVSHRDVGIGISQVLPVLVHAFGSRNKLIAIEQPEIHLHPALQAELGDLFIESALGENGNHFILETHSEHLLLRIMHRIRDTNAGKLDEKTPKVRPEDISVLFVEPLEGGSIVREMLLNERGELVKGWPGGFFEEGLREMFD